MQQECWTLSRGGNLASFGNFASKRLAHLSITQLDVSCDNGSTDDCSWKEGMVHAWDSNWHQRGSIRSQRNRKVATGVGGLWALCVSGTRKDGERAQKERGRGHRSHRHKLSQLVESLTLEYILSFLSPYSPPYVLPSECFQSASEVFVSVPHLKHCSVVLQLHTQTPTFLLSVYTLPQHQST